MQAGMNQMKDQAQDLIPKEIKEGEKAENNSGEGKIENSNDNSINNADPSNQSSASKSSKKKKKPKKINKQLALKMYGVLLCHTGLLTIVEYIIHAIQKSKESVFNSDQNLIYWVIFIASIILALLLSLLVTKIKCFSSVFFIYILYAVLLALDLSIFNIGAYLLSFEVFVSMLIVFDAATLVVLLFCSLSKDAPSNFWVILSSTGGIILAVFLCTKIYDEEKILVLIFGVYAFIIYEVMNYNLFNEDKDKKKKGKENEQAEGEQEVKVKVPPMMLLPYEFNASFIKLFLVIFKGIYMVIKGCCGKK